MLLSTALLTIDSSAPSEPSHYDVWYRVNLTSGQREAVCVRDDPETTLPRSQPIPGVALPGCIVSISGPGPVARLPTRVGSIAASLQLPLGHLELRLSMADIACPSIADLLALSWLRDAGVGLAVTDGAHDAIALLDRLPLTALVLAVQDVAGVPRDPASVSTIRSIVAAATARGIGVVAAGVATESQRALLCGLGCEAGEGELFGGT